MDLQMQEAVCCNLYAVIENNHITKYLCKLTGETPNCHLKASDKQFVDLNDCKNRI